MKIQSKNKPEGGKKQQSHKDEKGEQQASYLSCPGVRGWVGGNRLKAAASSTKAEDKHEVSR